MKMLLLTLMVFAGTAHARQYIQCAHYNSWDRVVINLDGEKSTLFMTDGVHNPDEVRILKRLYFVINDGKLARFETNEGEVKEVVLIPADKIGVPSRSFEVTMQMSSRTSGNSFSEFPMSCFSAIHDG